MTILDTNFLIDLLKDKPGTGKIADSIGHPKTTTINVFELFYGANSSARSEENISKINYLLKSIDLLEFDNTSALQAGIIQAKLMKIGKPIDPYT